MDAKPQRPRVRAHDENMPPPALPGKTLHQRTKSNPVLTNLMQAGAVKAANKKVLGEANTNTKVSKVAKDDSDLGKASPDKIERKEGGRFARERPAPRVLAPKPFPFVQSVQPVAAAAAAAATAKQQQQQQSSSGTSMSTIPAETSEANKVTAKKSTKVLRDVQPVGQGHTGAPSDTAQVVAPSRPKPVSGASSREAVPVQRQEVRTTESVPLREEPATRATTSSTATSMEVPQEFASQQEYLSYLALCQPSALVNRRSSGATAAAQSATEQDADGEEDCDYEDGYTTARSLGLRGDSTGGVTIILAPRATDKIQQELDVSKEFVAMTRSKDDVEDEQWDTSMVAEYGDEIFDYYRVLETRMTPNPTYMDQQQEIQWSMRAVLMDWVVQVHARFSLLPETLFLTVNFIDRFLSCKVVSLGKLQLVGATAIFVAAKYEEVQCPTISEIIYMVDGGYSAEELLKAERFMLSMLQFELGWPGPMSFLRRISKADDYDLETRTLAKYFLEVTIMDERFVGCTPSYLAAGAHCISRLMIHGDEWSKSHVYYSNYTWSQLQPLLAAILECCESPVKHHSAVYDKYTDKKFKRSSPYVQDQLRGGFVIPRDNPLPLEPLPIDAGAEHDYHLTAPAMGIPGLGGMLRQ